MPMAVSILPVVLIESTGLQKALFQMTVVGWHPYGKWGVKSFHNKLAGPMADGEVIL